jgi:hypothetical protein
MHKENVPPEGQMQQCVFRLIPVTKWNEYHPWPSVSGLRFLIFNEHSNGFHKCVLRIGRRVLIDEEQFFEWARNQQKENK